MGKYSLNQEKDLVSQLIYNYVNIHRHISMPKILKLYCQKSLRSFQNIVYILFLAKLMILSGSIFIIILACLLIFANKIDHKIKGFPLNL